MARGLYESRRLDSIHGIDSATMFDELWSFMDCLGLRPLLAGLDPGLRDYHLIPFEAFVALFVLRVAGGCPAMSALEQVALCDVGLMERLGFNAQAVLEGNNRRGLDRRKRPWPIRGAFCWETAADNLVTISLKALEALLNGTVARLAEKGFYPRKVDAVLDSSDLPTTPNCRMEGDRPVPLVTRSKRPRGRPGKPLPKMQMVVWGFKLWLAWDPASRLPLAVRFDDINVADCDHLVDLVDQARLNLGDHAALRSVAMDRGFIDGAALTELTDRMKLIVYIPVRSNMTIHGEALGIAQRAAQAAQGGKTVDATVVAERTVERRRGHGKNARVEQARLRVVGVQDLDCDWWCKEGSSSKSHRKDFRARQVTAVVVLEWPDRKDEPDEQDHPMVLLTNDPLASRGPLSGFDHYDDRSTIENQAFRVAKEQYLLLNPPKRTEAGMRVQAYLTFFLFAVLTALREEQRRTEEAEARGKETGLTRYRRRVQADNRDRSIVFLDGRYGIFEQYEVFLLVGIEVREAAELYKATRETVLERHTRAPPLKDTS